MIKTMDSHDPVNSCIGNQVPISILFPLIIFVCSWQDSRFGHFYVNSRYLRKIFWVTKLRNLLTILLAHARVNRGSTAFNFIALSRVLLISPGQILLSLVEDAGILCNNRVEPWCWAKRIVVKPYLRGSGVFVIRETAAGVFWTLSRFANSFGISLPTYHPLETRRAFRKFNIDALRLSGRPSVSLPPPSWTP